MNIKKSIEQWNSKYPYDRWWRKKYGIPFGSRKHREASHIDMAFEFHEDIFFQKLQKEIESKEDEEFDSMVGLNQNNENTTAKKTVVMKKKEIDEEFDNIDLDQFND